MQRTLNPNLPNTATGQITVTQQPSLGFAATVVQINSGGYFVAVQGVMGGAAVPPGNIGFTWPLDSATQNPLITITAVPTAATSTPVQVGYTGPPQPPSITFSNDPLPASPGVVGNPQQVANFISLLTTANTELQINTGLARSLTASVILTQGAADLYIIDADGPTPTQIQGTLIHDTSVPTATARSHALGEGTVDYDPVSKNLQTIHLPQNVNFEMVNTVPPNGPNFVQEQGTSAQSGVGASIAINTGSNLANGNTLFVWVVAPGKVGLACSDGTNAFTRLIDGPLALFAHTYAAGLASGTTITVSWTGNTSPLAMTLQEYKNVTLPADQTNTGGAQSSISTTGPLAQIGELVLAAAVKTAAMTMSNAGSGFTANTGAATGTAVSLQSAWGAFFTTPAVTFAPTLSATPSAIAIAAIPPTNPQVGPEMQVSVRLHF